MKKYKIIFSSNVETDIEEAVIYYNEQQKNLGKRFVKQVEVTLNAIKRNPYYTSVRYDNIRCAVVSVFPFLIHYKIDENARIISILAVYNTYRKPLWE